MVVLKSRMMGGRIGYFEVVEVVFSIRVVWERRMGLEGDGVVENALYREDFVLR